MHERHRLDQTQVERLERLPKYVLTPFDDDVHVSDVRDLLANELLMTERPAPYGSVPREPETLPSEWGPERQYFLDRQPEEQTE